MYELAVLLAASKQVDATGALMKGLVAGLAFGCVFAFVMGVSGAVERPGKALLLSLGFGLASFLLWKAFL